MPNAPHRKKPSMELPVFFVFFIFYAFSMGDLFDDDPGEWGLVSAGYYKVNYTDGGMTVNLVKGGCGN